MRQDKRRRDNVLHINCLVSPGPVPDEAGQLQEAVYAIAYYHANYTNSDGLTQDEELGQIRCLPHDLVSPDHSHRPDSLTKLLLPPPGYTFLQHRQKNVVKQEEGKLIKALGDILLEQNHLFFVRFSYGTCPRKQVLEHYKNQLLKEMKSG